MSAHDAESSGSTGAERLDWGPGQLRIVMMGTGPFAVPTFRALVECSPHQILRLITRPERRGPGDRAAPPNPMRAVAEAHHLPVDAPESINAPEAIAALRELSADLLVVCDYGQILSRDALATTRLGGINLHASLLPKYRGAAPINWAILAGDSETGVTVIQMTPTLDGGPWLAQTRYAIPPTSTVVEVEAALAEVGVEAVAHSIKQLAEHLATGVPLVSIPQPNEQATKAPRLKKTDGSVDWTRSAAHIANQVRALAAWPKTFTHWLRADGKPPVRLILEQVHVLDGSAQDVSASGATPGVVTQAASGQLHLACGSGTLAIDRLQPAGKRVMNVDEFLRGYPIAPGDRFGQ